MVELRIVLDGDEESRLLERCAHLGLDPEGMVKRALLVFMGLTVSAEVLICAQEHDADLRGLAEGRRFPQRRDRRGAPAGLDRGPLPQRADTHRLADAGSG